MNRFNSTMNKFNEFINYVNEERIKNYDVILSVPHREKTYPAHIECKQRGKEWKKP